MAAGIEGFSSEAGEEIAREISTENPSSCQIAQRRRITRAMVDRMGKAGFGAEIHGRREPLSEMSLRGQAADLLSRGASGNEISRIPGPARSTCHRLIEAHPQDQLLRQQGAWPRPMAYHAKAGARLCKWPRHAPPANAWPLAKTAPDAVKSHDRPLASLQAWDRPCFQCGPAIMPDPAFGRRP